MPQELNDNKRQVVPRWRPFRVAAKLGMLSSSSKRQHRELKLKEGELETLREDWRKYRTPPHASDLLDAALIIGQPEMAFDAAEFLRDNGLSAHSRELAASILQAAPENNATPAKITREERYRRIALAKRSLRTYPRNPIRWIDLARDYSILSQNDAAAAAIRRGLALARDDRFVIRSAARFYLHNEDPDRAHYILSRSGSTRFDPWLTAAEIVTAKAAGFTSKLVGHGRRMIESGQFGDLHISELAGAIGTLEHEAGNQRGVRRMFKKGLVAPTENTVAQALWISRHDGALRPPESVNEIPRAFEAGAWKALESENYELSIQLAWQWLLDEPFATRPAFFGALVAGAALGDFSVATEFVEAAQLANPDNPRVLAELVFCYASRDDLEKAVSILQKLPAAITRRPDERPMREWEVILAADKGLISFRQGDIEKGRLYYREAITMAKQSRLDRMQVLALVYYTCEEMRIGSEIASQLSKEARGQLEVLPPVVQPLYERLLSRTGDRSTTDLDP